MTRYSALRILAALAVAGAPNAGISAPITPASQSRTYNPYPLITNEGEALAVFEKGEKFIVFGDFHRDSDGHRAFAALMPTLRRSKVTVLGVEFPPSMNQMFVRMQDEIRNGASSESIGQQLKKEVNEYIKKSPVAKANGAKIDDQFIMETAEIISAATQHGIRVVGIDPRLENKRLWRSLGRYKGEDIIPPQQYSLDKKAAKIAARQIASDPPGSRMAIMYGAGHSCSDDRGSIKLANALEQHGSVKRVTLFLPESLPGRVLRQICEQPAKGPIVDPTFFIRSPPRLSP